MKIYVAARFYDKENVKSIYDQCREKGHEITVDWTVHKNIKPYDQNRDMAKEYAIEDLNGVKDCDVFIFITSEEAGTGTSSELGAALLSHVSFGNPKIYVVGKFLDKNFFFFHPSVTLKDTVEDVLSELL